MDQQEQEFFNYITEDIPDIDDTLFQDILDNGIETVEQLMDDLGYMEEGSMPDFITSHIDWQEVWDCELRHDYFTLESKDQTHFFSRHF